MRDLEDPNDPQASCLAPGAHVGSYRVERVLAEGGMGVVYVATHTLLPRRAALKVLRAELGGVPRALESLLEEARVLESLRDAPAVRVYDVGVLPDGRPWLAMELVDGACLAELIVPDAGLALERAATLVEAIASALAAAHALNVVHGDVKPENIIVTADSRAHLIDWGIARRMCVRQTHAAAVGTPPYMSPEQIRGEPLDERADVYALGVVAYELLTGSMPFGGADPSEVFCQHLATLPCAPRELRAELPVELDELVLAMLAKSPGARPTLAAIRAVCARFGGGLPELVAAPAAVELARVDTVSPAAARARWTPQLPLEARETTRLRRVVDAAGGAAAAGTIERLA